MFNKTILNFLRNFIPHKVIVCDDKTPLWFNGKIKFLINEKLKTFVYRKNVGNSQLRKNLSLIQSKNTS